MLKEEQAAELLVRCEAAVGKELSQVRGNLRNAETRAAAVWELLVIDAAFQIGFTEYEPHPGGSPDIRLHIPQGRPVWIEVAFLYPRFWREERKSEEVINWIFQEAKRRGISPYKIQYCLDGNTENKAGPIRTLPELHKRKEFLKDSGISQFFDDICYVPNEQHTFALSQYSIALSYTPNASEPYLSGSGLVQESPKTVKEHAVYRALKNKVRQHFVNGPRIVCIGSDQSPVLSLFTAPGQPKVRDAVAAAFYESRSLTAAIVVQIETLFSVFGKFEQRARTDFFVNPNAKDLLTEKEVQAFRKLNFNRWRYTDALQKWDRKNNELFRRIRGSITSRFRGDGMEIEVPANILVDALAGKTNLLKEYGLSEDNSIARALNDGWVVKSCSLKSGNIEAGEAPKVVLGMVPPPFSVYWPEKK